MLSALRPAGLCRLLPRYLFLVLLLASLHFPVASFAQTQLQAINAGGSAASPYVADADYSGGSTYSVTAAINTSGVTNPAPQAVYQTERYGNVTYTLPGYTPGVTYTVRLHFAENYVNGPSQRLFNVAINGTSVLTSFDIFAAAGGENIAVVRAYSAVADSNGNITIAFTNGSQNAAKIDGIEILSGAFTPTLTSIAVSPSSAALHPNGTQQFTATAKDQNGTALATQPTFTWSVASGAGTVSSAGLYTAGAAGGSATVKATSGSVSGTASVMVTNVAPTVATAAAATPNPATGTTTALSVLGADDGGESNLTYTWATTGTPPAAVSFSANGTNAAKNTTATFTKAGSYSFQVTIKDAGGLTATSSITVTVSQTLKTIAVTPNPAAVNTGGTQQVAASANDQFGTALATQPTFPGRSQAVSALSMPPACIRQDQRQAVQAFRPPAAASMEPPPSRSRHLISAFPLVPRA